MQNHISSLVHLVSTVVMQCVCSLNSFPSNNAIINFNFHTYTHAVANYAVL